MRRDTHFVFSETELRNGQSIQALCGEEIERANIMPIWDDLAVGMKLTLPETTILLCTGCLVKAFDIHATSPVKLYAVSERVNEVEE